MVAQRVYPPGPPHEKKTFLCVSSPNSPWSWSSLPYLMCVMTKTPESTSGPSFRLLARTRPAQTTAHQAFKIYIFFIYSFPLLGPPFIPAPISRPANSKITEMLFVSIFIIHTLACEYYVRLISYFFLKKWKRINVNTAFFKMEI